MPELKEESFTIPDVSVKEQVKKVKEDKPNHVKALPVTGLRREYGRLIVKVRYGNKIHSNPVEAGHVVQKHYLIDKKVFED